MTKTFAIVCLLLVGTMAADFKNSAFKSAPFPVNVAYDTLTAYTSESKLALWETTTTVSNDIATVKLTRNTIDAAGFDVTGAPVTIDNAFAAVDSRDTDYDFTSDGTIAIAYTISVDGKENLAIAEFDADISSASGVTKTTLTENTDATLEVEAKQLWHQDGYWVVTWTEENADTDTTKIQAFEIGDASKARFATPAVIGTDPRNLNCIPYDTDEAFCVYYEYDATAYKGVIVNLKTGKLGELETLPFSEDYEVEQIISTEDFYVVVAAAPGSGDGYEFLIEGSSTPKAVTITPDDGYESVVIQTGVGLPDGTFAVLLAHVADEAAKVVAQKFDKTGTAKGDATELATGVTGGYGVPIYDSYYVIFNDNSDTYFSKLYSDVALRYETDSESATFLQSGLIGLFALIAGLFVF